MLRCCTPRLLVLIFTIQWCSRSTRHMFDVSAVRCRNWYFNKMTNKWGRIVFSSFHCVLFRLATCCVICCFKITSWCTTQWSLCVISVFCVTPPQQLAVCSYIWRCVVLTPLICASPLVFQIQCHAVLSWVNRSWTDLPEKPPRCSPRPSWCQMELKVWVDGVVRVVCGLSEETSCQDVVIALAQAIGEYRELSNAVKSLCHHVAIQASKLLLDGTMFVCLTANLMALSD